LGQKIRIRGRVGRPEPLDRLSVQDARILKHEAGHIRGHTCKVLLVEEPRERALPTVEEIRASLAARLDAAPRLRQRLAFTPLHVANPVWVDDSEFDIERHVTAVSSAEPISRDRMSAVVGELMTERLDHHHPLWQLNVIERMADGSMALIWRIHHAMADGTTCVRLGSEVLWSDSPDSTPPQVLRWWPQPPPSGMSLLVSGLADRARQHPRRRGSVHPLRSFRESATIARRELAPSAGITELDHRPGLARQVAFAAAPIAECKRAAKAIDEAITINDVVLSLVAGGVRRWLSHRHDATGGIRAKVPVSLHRPDEGDGVANRDSYFFVDLPVAESDPVKRLQAINRETHERKLDHDAETLYRLGAHPFVAHWAMSPHVFTFNVSNVRGPARDIYVLGARVREMYSLAEIAPRHALRVAVISAAGTLFFGLCADREAVHDLDLLADGIERSVEELLAVAR
jgi:WS/DGAT/MGAT family acyltransferase